MRSWWKPAEPAKEPGRHWDGSIVFDALPAPPRPPGRHRACVENRNGSRSITDWPASPMIWVRRRDIASGGPCCNPECTVCPDLWVNNRKKRGTSYWVPKL